MSQMPLLPARHSKGRFQSRNTRVHTTQIAPCSHKVPPGNDIAAEHPNAKTWQVMLRVDRDAHECNEPVPFANAAVEPVVVPRLPVLVVCL